MRIGFDAKRAFLNRSGLGNYSRFIIESLSKYHPANTYFLFTPSIKGSLFSTKNFNNTHTVLPQKLFNKFFPSYWRVKSSVKDISGLDINLYHGLSGEIPLGLEKTNTKSIVTIHDLIFLRYPELYKPLDRKIYKVKFKNACKNADKIIAVSKQTKNDIIEFLLIPEDKIEVVYQSCHKNFLNEFTEGDFKEVRKKFNLPLEYILYVGTIEERKNLLTIVKAIHQGRINIPLVVVGRQTNYAKKVIDYIQKNKLSDIYFLKNVQDNDLPILFQMAKVFVYPSVFEGFGIPILEALYSKTPVITSSGGCFSEAGGPESIYIDPFNFEEMAFHIVKLLEDGAYSKKIAESGFQYAKRFSHEHLSNKLINIYNSISHVE